MSRFDEIRAAYPQLGFAVYALEPGGTVTLEVYAPNGEVFPFEGSTEAAVLDRAFPPAAPELQEEPPAPPASAFD